MSASGRNRLIAHRRTSLHLLTSCWRRRLQTLIRPQCLLIEVALGIVWRNFLMIHLGANLCKLSLIVIRHIINHLDAILNDYASRVIGSKYWPLACCINCVKLFMHNGYISGFLLKVNNLARLSKAYSSSTWTDSCSLNSLSLLESDLLNFTRIKESGVDGLFSYIVLNVCVRLVFVSSCMHLVLSFNEIFFILSDHLSVSLISFESICLILDHLTQMRLFCD